MVLKHRKSNRLLNFDYSSSGYYFITICTKNRQEYFGNIINNEMVINEIGKIVEAQWLWLEKQYKHVELDEFKIMPNHFHGIIIIKNKSNPVGTGLDLSLQKKHLSLSNIIGAFKTTSSIRIHKKGLKIFQWQRSFYDHIIRNEKSFYYICQYIKNNSINWSEDRNNCKK
ncbi:MAG: transposase [Patescibacteria group bacterium]